MTVLARVPRSHRPMVGLVAKAGLLALGVAAGATACTHPQGSAIPAQGVSIDWTAERFARDFGLPRATMRGQPSEFLVASFRLASFDSLAQAARADRAWQMATWLWNTYGRDHGNTGVNLEYGETVSNGIDAIECRCYLFSAAELGKR